MNTSANAMPDPALETPVAARSTRPMYWSLRRELWENRSIYLAPLVVALVALFGMLIGATRDLSQILGVLSALDAKGQRLAVVIPLSMAASVIILTGFAVAAYYCLGALNAERRDRSILFWKSMPVSDVTTVAAKALIALAVVPAVVFVVALATQSVMVLLGAGVLLGNGISPAPLWNLLPAIEMTVIMAYGIAVHSLWYAPAYGWLLLVSAWASRATFLWAALPIFAIVLIEKLALGTAGFASLVQYRFSGAMEEAFAVNAANTPVTSLALLEPLKFLGSPGLWLGLGFAAACFAGAVRLRRNRDPI